MISVLAAVQYYEEQGGTASVFINDDGMQCIQPELAEARRQYYRENGIGYTARLPNKKTSQKKTSGFNWFRKSKSVEGNTESEKDENPTTPQALANKIGFERKGKFKKASNMNYGLAFSNRVEDEMVRLAELECQQRGCANDDLTVEDDDRIYRQALANMLAEDEGRTCQYYFPIFAPEIASNFMQGLKEIFVSVNTFLCTLVFDNPPVTSSDD